MLKIAWHVPNFISHFISQALQSSLQEQQKGLNYLSTTVEEMSKKAPAEVSQKYRSEIEGILGRWKKLSAQLVENCQKLEEMMTKLQQFQVSRISFPHSSLLKYLTESSGIGHGTACIFIHLFKFLERKKS